GWYATASNALHNTLSTGIEMALMANEMEPVLKKLEELPATIWPASMEFRRAQTDLALGNINLAVRELDAALTKVRQLDAPTVKLWIEAALCSALIEHGEFDRARSLIRTLDASMDYQDLVSRGEAHMQLALATGDPGQALIAAQMMTEREGPGGLPLPAALLVVEAMIAVGSLD